MSLQLTIILQVISIRQPTLLQVTNLYVTLLEGLASYGGLLLAPAEGWRPMATWEGPLGPYCLII